MSPLAKANEGAATTLPRSDSGGKFHIGMERGQSAPVDAHNNTNNHHHHHGGLTSHNVLLALAAHRRDDGLSGPASNPDALVSRHSGSDTADYDDDGDF
ncbi:unnamed protein product [Lampetra planeri]